MGRWRTVCRTADLRCADGGSHQSIPISGKLTILASVLEKLFIVAFVPACSLLTNLDDLSRTGATDAAGEASDARVDDGAALDATLDASSTDAASDAPLPIGPVFFDDFDHWETSTGPWDFKSGTNPVAQASAPSAPNVGAFSANGTLPPDVYLKKTLSLGGTPQSLTCTMQVHGSVSSMSGSTGPQIVALAGGPKRIKLSLTPSTIVMDDYLSGTPAASNSFVRTPILSSTWEPLVLELFANGESLVKFGGQQFPFTDSSPFLVDSMVLELGFQNPATGTYEIDFDDVSCATQ